MAGLQCFFWVLLVSVYAAEGSKTLSGKSCMTKCTKLTVGSNGNPYCFYNRIDKEDCERDGQIMKFFTTDGKLCNGVCRKEGTPYEWCFTGDHTRPNEHWGRCSTSYSSTYPPKSILEDYYKNLALHTAYTLEEYSRSITTLSANRQKRDTTFRQTIDPNEIDKVVAALEENDEDFTIQSFVQNEMPVRTVTTFEMPADAAHPTPADATIAMRAEIHPRHRDQRKDISGEVKKHMKLLDREADDEAGHLLADSLGGPVLPYNFAPQSPFMNRAVEAGAVVTPPTWYDVEGVIRKFLDKDIGYVRWALVVGYRQFPVSRRPTRFFLSIRFYNKQGQPVKFGGAYAATFDLPNIPTSVSTDMAKLRDWWAKH